MLTLITNRSFAQGNAPGLADGITSVLHPSPNAASLGKFIEVPVSLHTGLPIITIPLWQLNQGDLAVNVALNYHGGGIKVDEIASWAGLGWSVGGSGVITRATRGLPDDLASFKTIDLPRINRYRLETMPLTEQQQFLLQVWRGVWDSEPDMYNLSIGDLSCRFFIGETGEYVVAPKESNIKVEDDLLPNGTSVGWLVTDAKGVRYRLGLQESNTTTTTASVVGGQANEVGYSSGVPSSWWLTEMEDTKGNKITFTYQNEGNSFNNRASEYVKLPLGGAPCSFERGYTFVQTDATTQRLASIRCGREEIRFVPDPAPRIDLPGSYGLQAVEVRFDNAVKRRFRLTKGDFPAWGSTSLVNPDEHRLKLESVQEESGDGAVVLPAYQFTYNTEQLPPRNSYDQDHWGFYNKANNTTGVSLPIDIGGQPQGANKNPNPDYSRAALLTAIRYPTGGKTEFEYEPNSYVKQPASPTTWSENHFLAGGEINADQTRQAFNYTAPFEITEEDAAFNPRGIWAVLKLTLTPSPADVGGFTWNAFVDRVNPDGSRTDVPFTVMTGERRANLIPGRYLLTLSVDREFLVESPFVYLSAAVSVPLFHRNTPSPAVEAVGPGLRIRQITKHFGVGPPEVRTYDYNDPISGTTTGYLGNFPIYYLRKYTSGPGQNCLFDTFTSYSNYPLINTKASLIGYSHVTEYFDLAKSSGKKTYTYSGFHSHNDINAETAFPFPPNSPQDWKRGLPLVTETFKSPAAGGGGTFEKVRAEASTYATLPGSLTMGHGIKVAAGTTMVGQQNELAYYLALSAVAYPIQSDSHQLQEQTTTEYTPGNSLQTITAYKYTPDTYLPRRITSLNSDGSRTIQRFNYPTDYRANASSSPLLTELLAANRVSSPIEQTTLRKTATSARLVSGVVHEYASVAGADGRQRYYLQKIHQANTASTDTSSRYNFL
ncbi:MAG TPA: hypothetical protein VF690_21625, partial [Hymenobacter sp.]